MIDLISHCLTPMNGDVLKAHYRSSHFLTEAVADFASERWDWGGAARRQGPIQARAALVAN